MTLLHRRPWLAALLVTSASLPVLACSSSSASGSKASLGAACSADGDCASGTCLNLGGPKQCTVSCGAAATCAQVDPEGICQDPGLGQEYCVRSCSSSTVCPSGAQCTNGACYQVP